MTLLGVGSSSSNINVGMANINSLGLQSGTATISFLSDGSGSSGLGSTALGSELVTLTIEANVYGGSGTWLGGSGSSWSNFANWDSGGAPVWPAA